MDARRLMRLVIVIAVLASVTVRTNTEAMANQATERERPAADAAYAFFDLAVAGQYNALYDVIHPDAHAVVPRVVATGAFEEIYATAQPDLAVVIDVQIGPWTWPVTGDRYEDAATVFYDQPYQENGQTRTLQSEMYLVEVEGAWRWFFGTDAAYVEAATKRYLPEGSAGDPIDALTGVPLIEYVVTDLDDFFRDAFASSEFDYRSPGVVLVPPGEAASTACGPASDGFWAFYCPPDQTIYLDQAFLDDLEFGSGDFAVAFVIAHEWAHHAQTGVGIERSASPDEYGELYSIELELMADCLTGVYALDARTRGVIVEDDVQEAADFAITYLGDPPGIDEYSERAHGTAEQRASAFLVGNRDGFLGCGEAL